MHFTLPSEGAVLASLHSGALTRQNRCDATMLLAKMKQKIFRLNFVSLYCTFANNSQRRHMFTGRLSVCPTVVLKQLFRLTRSLYFVNRFH